VSVSHLHKNHDQPALPDSSTVSISKFDKLPTGQAFQRFYQVDIHLFYKFPGAFCDRENTTPLETTRFKSG
jgi:hypothetical protein